MATIRDLSTQAAALGLPATTWRDRLLPAHFDGRMFHVESASVDTGRRIALHEFPKKEKPYAEDMGRRAVEFTVRGYVIVYPHDDPGEALLYRRDYTLARDALDERLARGGPGMLQLPTMIKQVMLVVCTRYRMSEESRLGGFCTFDMSFVERGVQPFQTAIDTSALLTAQTAAMTRAVSEAWARQRTLKSTTLIGRSGVGSGPQQSLPPFSG